MAPYYHRRLLWPPDSSNDGESTDPSSPPPISGSLQFSPPPPPHQARFFAIGASLIAFALILFTYYVTFRWYPSLRRRRRRHTPRFAFAPPLDPPAPPEADGDLRRDLLAGAGEGEPYHVWLIRTRGLDAQTIGSISVCAYKREEGLVEGTDCSICLGEFMEGEMLRLLPKCSHAFHIPCIDTWLRSRVNCPLCRAPILAPRPLAPPPPIASSSGDLDPPSSAGNEPSSRITTPAEEESAPGADTAPEQSAIAPAGSSSSGAESEVWETIDLTKAEDDEAPCVQLEPLRRSVSMDSMALGSFLLRMSLVGGCNSGYSRRPAAGEQTSGCRNGAKEEDAAEMGRSSSTNGGVGFLSRISGRARRQ